MRLAEFYNGGGYNPRRQRIVESRSNVRDFATQLQSQLHARLQRVGGPRRVYEIDGAGQRGAIYVIGMTTSAIGIGWDISKVVKSIYLWRNHFNVFRSPDYAIDVPSNTGSLSEDLVEKIAELLKHPEIGPIILESKRNSRRPMVMEAKRTTDVEFIRMAREMFGTKANKLTLVDLNKIAAENDVQVPTTIKMTKDFKAILPNGKTDPHHWNLSGGSGEAGENVDAALSKSLGGSVEKADAVSPEYQDALDLAKAKTVTKMASQGKVYLMGRKPNGAFFRIPGLETYSAQLERILVNQLETADPNRQGMEEQYNMLRSKVKLVAGGKTAFIKSLLITGAPSSGKALALDTPIPTPNGWTTMGELNVGDKIFDDKGKICEVTFATPVQLNRECYEVVFDDGTKIVADADHRWFTSTVSSRYSTIRNKRIWENRDTNIFKKRGTDQSHKRTFPSVVNTYEIANSLKSHGKYNHQINTCDSIDVQEYPKLPINPYILGLWLGDGCHVNTTLTCGKKDIEQLRELLILENQNFKETLTKKGVYHIQLSSGRCGKQSEKLRGKLNNLGLLGNKHVPVSFLRASTSDRMSLLQGLMDTDGTISKNGNCEFSASNKRLAYDFHELVSSLGIKASITSKTSKLNGVNKKESFRVFFSTSHQVFRYKRKLARQKESNRHENARTIIECNPVQSVPVRCITVDSPTHLFLCSRSFIPTHNTYNVMEVIKSLGLNPGKDYIVKKGRITVTSMYRTLIEQINGLVIFDDCDSVVEDKNGINMLKGALDTDPVREISYDVRGNLNTAVMEPAERDETVAGISRILRGKPEPADIAKFEKYLRKKSPKKKSSEEDEEENEENEENEDAEPVAPEGVDLKILDLQDFFSKHLPNKIDFRGRIIFISNMDESEWDSAILTRAFTINMNFTSSEMLDYIDKIKQHIPHPELTEEDKQEVVDYIRGLWQSGKLKRQINFRLIQAGFDLRTDDNWKQLIMEF